MAAAATLVRGGLEACRPGLWLYGVINAESPLHLPTDTGSGTSEDALLWRRHPITLKSSHVTRYMSKSMTT